MKSVNVKSKKQGGFVLTTELVLLVTILVLGSIVGMISMRNSLTAEMEDVSEAIGALNQTYFFDGIANSDTDPTAVISGSQFIDAPDVTAGDGQPLIFTEVPPEGEGFGGPEAIIIPVP